jgi:Divergent InlB B-repeat domain
MFLITAALIAGMVGCGPTAPSYSLTIASTAGGSVTTPGEDTFTYDELTVVNLVAEAEEGYYFVNWSGDVGTVACVIAATTTVTMNADYSIMADFEEWVWIFPNPNIEAIVGDIRERGYLFPSDVQDHNPFHPQP